MNPELIITAAARDEWYRRNPRARPGILEDLAARGVLLIIDQPAAVMRSAGVA